MADGANIPPNGKERRAVQYVSVAGKVVVALWALAISVIGLIFSLGTFYGHSVTAESEIRSAIAATESDHIWMGEGISSLSETMSAVVAEQTALRRDVERIRDGGN